MAQRRGMHMAHRLSKPKITKSQDNVLRHQKRNLHLKQSQAADMLRERGVPVSLTPSPAAEDRLLVISIDRSKFSPCIVASPTVDADDQRLQARRFAFDYQTGFDLNSISSITEHLGLPASSADALSTLVQSLLEIFRTKEAFLLETRIALNDEGDLEVRGARFGFDDAAFKSNRQLDVQKLRSVEDEVPEEVEAEKDGIVYIKSV